jgi:organic radical activating enzyme
VTASLIDTRKRLDAVSPSFCLAKWLQVTLHLQNGHNHSCHHPGTHQTPLDELGRDPSALHNTSFKKRLRRDMLTGVRPAECEYCWKVEDASPENISDRVVKSHDAWSAPHFDRIRLAPWDGATLPSYVEVSFSNVCNFACSYCGPWASSKWVEEIRQHGPYVDARRFNNLEDLAAARRMPIPEREENPYIDAFWEWWPTLYPKLEVFRITGGEPLLSKHTMRVLRWILDNPRPDLQLAVNSNLGVPDQLYKEFLTLVQEIVTRGCVKRFELYTSVDAYGARAEYIRNGLDYGQWLGNVRRYLESVPDQRLVVMCTFNALSITSFPRLYGDILALRTGYPASEVEAEPGGRVRIDLPYLRNPDHQSVMILPSTYADRMDDIVASVVAAPGSLEMEGVQLRRIRSLMAPQTPSAKLNQARASFYNFFSEHDRRRGTSFLATYPEMASFWRLCREQAVAARPGRGDR